MTPEERMQIHERMDKKRSDLRDELESQYGVSGHAKATRLFGLAWEYGHSAGVEEVRSYYSSLVELLST